MSFLFENIVCFVHSDLLHTRDVRLDKNSEIHKALLLTGTVGRFLELCFHVSNSKPFVHTAIVFFFPTASVYNRRKPDRSHSDLQECALNAGIITVRFTNLRSCSRYEVVGAT